MSPDLCTSSVFLACARKDKKKIAQENSSPDYCYYVTSITTALNGCLKLIAVLMEERRLVLVFNRLLKYRVWLFQIL